jgi:hypothetical protein
MVTIQVAPEHGVPWTRVRVAKRYKREAEKHAARAGDENLAFDSVWCVFDIDDHPRVADAKQMARDNGIDMAISNPCVELWLLLHFRDNPGMQDRATMREILTKHVPEYDKHVDYATYLAGYAQAVKRAEQLDKLAENTSKPGHNPTTGVYRLTELIRTG